MRSYWLVAAYLAICFGCGSRNAAQAPSQPTPPPPPGALQSTADDGGTSVKVDELP